SRSDMAYRRPSGDLVEVGEQEGVLAAGVVSLDAAVLAAPDLEEVTGGDGAVLGAAAQVLGGLVAPDVEDAVEAGLDAGGGDGVRGGVLVEVAAHDEGGGFPAGLGRESDADGQLVQRGYVL